jgi:kynureninase
VPSTPTTPGTTTRAAAAALDAGSPLADRRRLFDLPDDLVYLCGNSLGALPHAVPERMAELIRAEWGHGLVGSWNTADWAGAAGRVAAGVAPLVGAAPEDLTAGDSTSVSLFGLLVAAARLRPDRRVVVVEESTFPTDGYVAAGVAELLGLELRWCDPSDPAAALDRDVAVLALTHVDYRTGAMFDMPAVTAAAHEAGAVVLWDLCHSTGAVPVDLTAADADLAVGCGYKYLNGGPGAPAYAWVHPRHQDLLEPPIKGWWGHARPFDMARDFEPAPGVGRLRAGTPPVLALSAMAAALSVFDGVAPADLRSVSLSLTDHFLHLLDERLPGLEIATPREHARRGSQVSVRHPDAYGVVQALAARGVIGDFRGPDLARFGLAPLYVRHVDVHDAVEHLVAVIEREEHRDPAYARRNAVT